MDRNNVGGAIVASAYAENCLSDAHLKILNQIQLKMIYGNSLLIVLLHPYNLVKTKRMGNSRDMWSLLMALH